MELFDRIVFVTSGAALLGLLFGRGPAEPLAVTIRNLALFVVGMLGFTVLIQMMPIDLRLPAVIAGEVLLLLASLWWYRRHPPRRVWFAVETANPPLPSDRGIVASGEWARALLLIGATAALITVMILITIPLLSPA